MTGQALRKGLSVFGSQAQGLYSRANGLQNPPIYDLHSQTSSCPQCPQTYLGKLLALHLLVFPFSNSDFVFLSALAHFHSANCTLVATKSRACPWPAEDKTVTAWLLAQSKSAEGSTSFATFMDIFGPGREVSGSDKLEQTFLKISRSSFQKICSSSRSQQGFRLS